MESCQSGKPTFCAKLSAALVGFPAASNATDFGGPVISFTSSGCFDARVHMAASRRGAPKTFYWRLLKEIISRKIFFKYYMKFFDCSRQHACRNFFTPNLKQEICRSLHRATPDWLATAALD